jgi:hypothetical protein
MPCPPVSPPPQRSQPSPPRPPRMRPAARPRRPPPGPHRPWIPAARISALGDLLKKYKDAYYNGHPLVSDAAFDQLEDELRALDPRHGLLASVGAPVPAQGQAAGGGRPGHRVGEGPAQDPHGVAQQGRGRGRVPGLGDPLRGARGQGEAPQGAGRPVRHREAGRHLAGGHLRGRRPDGGHHPRRRPGRGAHHRQCRPNEGCACPGSRSRSISPSAARSSSS